MNKAAQQLGKLGGKATLIKHGKEHYQKLAAHMNEVLKLKREENRGTAGKS